MTPTTWPYCASFPITGPVIHPSADDYEREVTLIGDAARSIWTGPRGSPQPTAYGQLRELARIFVRLARRKAWAEEMAAHRLAHREAA